MKKSKTLTLDLGNISFRQALEQFDGFCVYEQPKRAQLYLSPFKGFHVYAEFAQEIDNWRLRDIWKDDGNRLVCEMLALNNNRREFLWNGKVLAQWNFEETLVAFFQKSMVWITETHGDNSFRALEGEANE